MSDSFGRTGLLHACCTASCTPDPPTLHRSAFTAYSTVTQVPGYRAAILALVPALRVLDDSAIALDAVVDAALQAAPSPSTLSDADLGITGLDPTLIPRLAREAENAVHTAGAAAARAAARASPAEQAFKGTWLRCHQCGIGANLALLLTAAHQTARCAPQKT